MNLPIVAIGSAFLAEIEHPVQRKFQLKVWRISNFILQENDLYFC